MIDNIKDIFQITLQMANLVIIVYGGYKFLNKPHDTLEEKVKGLEERIRELEIRIKDQDESLRIGNDRFRKQRRTNAAFKAIKYGIH